MTIDQRELFEQWYSTDGAVPEAIVRIGENYSRGRTQSAWLTWQACARVNRDALASNLIDKWVVIHRAPITWQNAVGIVAIFTQMPDDERQRLLDLDKPGN